MDLEEGGGEVLGEEDEIEYIRKDLVDEENLRAERRMEVMIHKVLREQEDMRYRERQVTTLAFAGLLVITLLAMLDAGLVHLGRKTSVENCK